MTRIHHSQRQPQPQPQSSRLSIFLLGLLSLHVISLSSLSTVQAFPIGAGDCPEGRAAVGSVHLSADDVTTGSLEDRGLRVVINGQMLNPNTPITLQAGVEHTWMVSDGTAQSRMNSEGFRGFLLRLGGGGVRAGDPGIDTTVALSSANDNVKEAFAACVLSQGVGGMTHTDNNLKTAVSGILRLEETATDLQLDVTIVVENRNSNSEYYYSSYAIAFEADVKPTPPPMTFAPTTGSPSTEVPTETIVETMAPSTTEPVSDNPATSAPVSTPQPTLAPVDNINPQEEKELSIVLGGCTRSRPCGNCEGDCNRNEDCAGDLECFRRPGDHDTPIPGCGGAGRRGYDYCYEPSDLTLRLRSPFCTKQNPCDLCQGDCNSDAECEEGLKCFHRSYREHMPIPGCDGLGIAGLDYCYDERTVDELEEIEMGECDEDGDCPAVDCTEGETCLVNVCRQAMCVLVEQCGASLCGTGEYCCNESCGICAPAGGACIQEFCETCGDVTCNAGESCCGPDCGICAPVGGTCPDICTGPIIIPEDNTAVALESCEADDDCFAMPCNEEPCFDYVCRESVCVLVEECGNTECDPEVDYCCNASCGICAPLGGSCVQVVCEACGDEICYNGDSCCSPDCGVCVSPEDTCPEECTNDYWSFPNNEVIQDERQDDQETVSGVIQDETQPDQESNSEVIQDERQDDEELISGGVQDEAQTDQETNNEEGQNDYWSLPNTEGIQDEAQADQESGEINESDAEEGGCQTDDDCTDTIPCTLEPCPVFACRDSQCALVQPCGESECNEFEYCCNESCSICVPFDNDVGCTNEFCEADSEGSDTEENGSPSQFLQCTEDVDCPIFLCSSDACPEIECRDNKCLLFISCGENKCIDDEVCCCGTCKPANVECPETCEPCGDSVCDPGEICCNASCGVCTSVGGFCSAEICEGK